MNYYMMACDKYLIDYSEWKLIHIIEKQPDVEILVPNFIWRYGSIDSYTKQGVSGTFKKTFFIPMHNFTLQLESEKERITIHLRHDGNNVIIGFNPQHFFKRVLGKPELISAEYEVAVNGVLGKTYKSIFLRMKDSLIEDWPFHYVNGLSYNSILETSDRRFAFGLWNIQYRIFFREKKLEGTSYALLLGTYAILLKDDLSFDSLVTLGAVYKGELHINDIIYTVNPYVTKLKMLGG